FNRLGEQRFRREAELQQHGDSHEGGTAEQHAGLDDLHPGGGSHAAEQHVHHHHGTDQDFGVEVVHAEEHLDQLTGTDHLRNHVEGDDDQGGGSGEDANRGLGETVGSHVSERELAQVAQTLGHQEGDDRPADQPADREDQAVEAVGEHETGNTQEGSGGHVVASNRQAVLEAGDTATAGVEVGSRLGLGSSPLGDEEGAADEDRKHGNCDPVGGLLGGI